MENENADEGQQEEAEEAGEQEEEKEQEEAKEQEQTEQEIPATQPDPVTPAKSPVKVLQEIHMPLQLRTPTKVMKDGYEDPGERFDTMLAWTLGGDLPPTVKLGDAWEPTPPRQSKCYEDDLEAAEAELRALSLLDGIYTTVLVPSLWIVNHYHWPSNL